MSKARFMLGYSFSIAVFRTLCQCVGESFKRKTLYFLRQRKENGLFCDWVSCDWENSIVKLNKRNIKCSEIHCLHAESSFQVASNPLRTINPARKICFGYLKSDGFVCFLFVCLVFWLFVCFNLVFGCYLVIFCTFSWTFTNWKIPKIVQIF